MDDYLINTENKVHNLKPKADISVVIDQINETKA
tara:strand:- start:4559 stop:4660 length:102 start_codon:yes stop_codon:yes gene_type:complete